MVGAGVPTGRKLAAGDAQVAVQSQPSAGVVDQAHVVVLVETDAVVKINVGNLVGTDRIAQFNGTPLVRAEPRACPRHLAAVEVHGAALGGVPQCHSSDSWVKASYRHVGIESFTPQIGLFISQPVHKHGSAGDVQLLLRAEGAYPDISTRVLKNHLAAAIGRTDVPIPTASIMNVAGMRAK